MRRKYNFDYEVLHRCIRVQSQLACKALSELEKVAPKIADRLLKESARHSARIRHNRF